MAAWSQGLRKGQAIIKPIEMCDKILHKNAWDAANPKNCQEEWRDQSLGF